MQDATTQNDLPLDLIEAQQIVEQLGRIDHTLNIPDQKFVESWHLYLSRTGDAARVGRFRLMRLRKIAAIYGVEVERLIEVDEHNFEVLSDLVIS